MADGYTQLIWFGRDAQKNERMTLRMLYVVCIHQDYAFKQRGQFIAWPYKIDDMPLMALMENNGTVIFLFHCGSTSEGGVLFK